MQNHEDYEGMLFALIETRALNECENHAGQYFKLKMVLDTDPQILQLKSREGMKPYTQMGDDEFCSLVRVVYNDHPNTCTQCN